MEDFYNYLRYKTKSQAPGFLFRKTGHSRNEFTSKRASKVDIRNPFKKIKKKWWIIKKIWIKLTIDNNAVF